MIKMVKFFNVCVSTVTVLTCVMVAIFTIPQLFHITPFVVLSGSMEPNIPTGSVVFTNKNDKENLRIGDVVTFGLSTGDDSVFVTHRVYKLDEEKNLVQTKGDANDHADNFISKDAVVGTVICYIPRIGFLLQGVQSNYGYLVLVVSLAILNIFAALLNHTILPRDDNTISTSPT